MYLSCGMDFIGTTSENYEVRAILDMVFRYIEDGGHLVPLTDINTLVDFSIRYCDRKWSAGYNTIGNGSKQFHDFTDKAMKKILMSYFIEVNFNKSKLTKRYIKELRHLVF